MSTPRALPRTTPPDVGSRSPRARGLRSLRSRSGHSVTATHAHAVAPSDRPDGQLPGAVLAPSPIAVALVRRVDGSCAPIDRAFVYRCEPSQPAVAVIDDGGGVRRFLGGQYAVGVPNVPPTAFAIGVTGFGALFEDPTNFPAFLWVEADGKTERWLAIPNRNKLSDPTTVQMIGDSILDGGQTEVVASLPTWTVTIDALIGRGSEGAAGVAESGRTRPPTRS